ncbi:DUF1641 domain-containing protein [Vulcanisaeta thermophila]|uniref:DUF1641 domain-containing protein n=1 Tax=Vulcanisaeta thermophila TaxID=867917 RepID=UPI0008535A96|nr:DUF1641 domain-containing protein [Vulcanisaeta thermophila]
MSIEIPRRVLEERVKDMDKDKAVLESMDKLLILSESGALDTLVDLALTLKNISSVITDDMVDNIAVMIRDLLGIVGNVVGNPVVKVVSDSINDPEVDRALLSIKDRKIGLSQIISLMRDPDVLTGLYIFLVIMKAMGINFRKYVESMGKR